MPEPTFEASDRPMHADQYLLVATHAWWLGSFGRHNHLTEHRSQQWVPARPEREWLLVRELAGGRTWLTGSAQDAVDDGYDLAECPSVGRFRAPYGEFDSSGDDGFCGASSRPRRGSWQVPTAEFLTRLPRDPDLLRDRLTEENPGNWFGPFTAAVTALRTCLVPADLRTALYRAITGLPAVTVGDRTANLDGHPCLVVVHDAGRTRTELLVDPVHGQFAGERDTLRIDSRCGLRAGTVISEAAVTTVVVDALGELPAA